ncbi:MAG TPA: hypothetical protein VGC55_07525 [Dokdonella sp.]
MSQQVVKVLRRLHSKRDLRSEILDLAAAIGEEKAGRLEIVAPVIAPETIREEWERLLPVLVPSVRERMRLHIEQAPHSSLIPKRAGIVPLSRPNYRFEVLRLLIGASLEDDGPQSLQGIIEKIGVSQTPIRAALQDLKRAGLLSPWTRSLELAAPESLSSELLAKVGALPETLRFRFERGAPIKPPAMLLRRALPLLHAKARKGWETMALSGVPVAQKDVPQLDLVGVPRLDLLAQIGRDAEVFDTSLLRDVDDGLELEPNVLAPAPVVVTLVRADTVFVRDIGLDRARCAYPHDVLMSLLDLGLRDQTIQYANAIRRADREPPAS